MADCNITLSISVAWWVRYYLFGVGFVAGLCGAEPDMRKVTRMVIRGLTVKEARNGN